MVEFASHFSLAGDKNEIDMGTRIKDINELDLIHGDFHLSNSGPKSGDQIQDWSNLGLKRGEKREVPGPR